MDDEVSIEEIKKLFHSKPTYPEELVWKKLFSTLRLRMNITPENASTLLINACRKFIYPNTFISS